jgi:hypothetical protein
MKLTYDGKTIDFFDRPIDKFLLSLSGGLDSAVLFYLICKHFPEKYVVPMIGIDHYARWDALCAEENIQYMKDRFPNANIGPTETFTFNHEDEYWMKRAKDEFEQRDLKTIPGLSKVLQMEKGFRSIREKTNIQWVVSGTTANPPMDEMVKHGFDHLSEPFRNNGIQNQWNALHYVPWINSDKRFIAAIYKDENLMDDLFPYTNSCVGMPHETDYGQKECGVCFWCHEKKWGFNL